MRDAGKPRPCRQSAFELGIVLAYAAWALHGFWNRLDFHPADEAVYFEQGRRLVRGDWAVLLARSPLMSALYGVLDLVLPAAMHPSDVLFASVPVDQMTG